MSEQPIATVFDQDEPEGGQFFVDVQFDGRSEKCFLDTGATSTTVRANSFFSAYPSLRESKSVGVSRKAAVAAKIQIKDIRVGTEHSSGMELKELA